jgi:hypothetical protein
VRLRQYSEHEIAFEIERGDETVDVTVLCHLEGLSIPPSLYYPGEEPDLVVTSCVGEEYGLPYELTEAEAGALWEIVRERQRWLEERDTWLEEREW